MSKISYEKIHSYVSNFINNCKDIDIIKSWESEKTKNEIKNQNFYKTVKDPNKPKKNTSSYLFFCSENRRSVRQELGDIPKATEITIELAKRWNDLKNKTDHDSLNKIQYYEILGNKDKERYEEEMEKYNKTLPEDKIKIKSAFMFFCEEVIDSVKNDLPYNSSKKILKEKLSEMWKETKINNKEEFKKYKSLAKEYQNK